MNKQELKEAVIHMFNRAANMVVGTETVLPQIDGTHYSKPTKLHIRTHLSHDIANLLMLMEPVFPFMKEEFPERVEQIERWEKLLIQVNEFQARGDTLQDDESVVQ